MAEENAGFTFSQMPNWIVSSGLLAAMPNPCVKVMTCYVYHANSRTRMAWPSYSTIAKETGLRSQSIRDSVRWLVDHGVLEFDGMAVMVKRYKVVCSPEHQSTPASGVLQPVEYSSGESATTPVGRVLPLQPVERELYDGTRRLELDESCACGTMSPMTPCHPCHDVTPTPDIMSPPPLTPCHPNKTKSKKTNQEDSPTDVGGLFADDELGPKVSDPKPVRKKFVPPTYEEAVEYGKTIGLPEDECRGFVDRGIAVGWVVGRSVPMKDWKGAMRLWLRKYMEHRPPSNPPQQVHRPPQPAKSPYSPPPLTREERKALNDAFDKCDRPPAASEP